MNHGVHPIAWMAGFAMLAIIVGVFALALLNRPIPDIVNDLTTLVVGGVIGMLANTRLARPPSDEPTEVEVVNAPESPVPTTDSGLT